MKRNKIFIIQRNIGMNINISKKIPNKNYIIKTMIIRI